MHLSNNIFQTDFTAFEQKCGEAGGIQCCPGEAQRLSSLTFGCFQVKAKNSQVLTGPKPSQRSLSSPENQGQDKNGKDQLAKAMDVNSACGWVTLLHTFFLFLFFCTSVC